MTSETRRVREARPLRRVTRAVAFDPKGWEDYVYWQTQDRRTLQRLVYFVTDEYIVTLQAREHY